MRLKSIILSFMACLAFSMAAQPAQQQPEWEWYLGEVVNDVFVGRNYFEYYYTPSAADMQSQRDKGEVTYFLNSPEGLNVNKVRDMVDRLMASYDDIKAVGDWHMTQTTYWKEFRFENNKFRFSVKRKALDDGTYYVSATETASYYKSLGKKKQDKDTEEKVAEGKASDDKPITKSSRRNKRDRRAITQEDVEASTADDLTAQLTDGADDDAAPEEAKQPSAREQREAQRARERAARRNAEQERRELAAKAKEEQKQRKAEEKKRKEEEKQKKEEEKRLKREEEKREREQARLEREQAQREQAAQRKQAAAAQQQAQSNFNYDDIALWLSEKYDFTQTAAGPSSVTMFSTAVKDREMAKLAIKNALKGSNARMAVPWRLNSETGQVETGYTVDDHVLVFAIGNDQDGNVTLTVTEVSNDDFELFKQQLQP